LARDEIMSRAQPLYRHLADTLRAAIGFGTYQTGDLLPTELELCATHNISRHTAREALRLLTDEGLISRKRGAGTVVIATNPTGPFSQDWGEIGDILQYARDTRLIVQTYGQATSADLADAGLDPALSWLKVTGLRQRLEGGPPLALTSICVRADLMPPREIVESWPQAIGEYIATHNQVRAARIDQEISAIILDKVSAKNLGERTGDPALRTLRRYYDAQRQTFIASISIHPGDRFAYRMSAER
jgi:GntR family transcriptional regulator